MVTRGGVVSVAMVIGLIPVFCNEVFASLVIALSGFLLLLL